jgi:hypothetical protein
MSEKKTEKSCYQSRFGANWITASQYLAENMCSRKSRSDEGKDLPQKFWTDKYWEKQLLLQIRHANELLKQYSVSSILKALKHPDCKRVYSLGLKSVLVPLIERFERQEATTQKVLEAKMATAKDAETTEDITPVDVCQKPRPAFSTSKNKSKNYLQRLRELDNGQKQQEEG